MVEYNMKTILYRPLKQKINKNYLKCNMKKTLYNHIKGNLRTILKFDVVGLSWLTCLIMWTSGVISLVWQILFRKVSTNYRGVTLLSLVSPELIENRDQSTVRPRIQGGQCRFWTLDQLYPLTWILEGSWNFSQTIHMCFVDLGRLGKKIIDYANQGTLWGFF